MFIKIMFFPISKRSSFEFCYRNNEVHRCFVILLVLSLEILKGHKHKLRVLYSVTQSGVIDRPCECNTVEKVVTDSSYFTAMKCQLI